MLVEQVQRRVSVHEAIQHARIGEPVCVSIGESGPGKLTRGGTDAYEEDYCPTDEDEEAYCQSPAAAPTPEKDFIDNCPVALQRTMARGYQVGDLQVGDLVEIWSAKSNTWIKDAKVVHIVKETCSRDGFERRAGSVKVVYNELFQWVPPFIGDSRNEEEDEVLDVDDDTFMEGWFREVAPTPEEECTDNSAGAKQRKKAKCYHVGDFVEIWSFKFNRWLKDAKVVDKVEETCSMDGFKRGAGSVKVAYKESCRWVSPAESEDQLKSASKGLVTPMQMHPPMSRAAAPQKRADVYQVGDFVEILSIKSNTWIKDAKVVKTLEEMCSIDGIELRAGSVKVVYNYYNYNRRFKWVSPQHFELLLRLPTPMHVEIHHHHYHHNSVKGGA